MVTEDSKVLLRQEQLSSLTDYENKLEGIGLSVEDIIRADQEMRPKIHWEIPVPIFNQLKLTSEGFKTVLGHPVEIEGNGREIKLIYTFQNRQKIEYIILLRSEKN